MVSPKKNQTERGSSLPVVKMAKDSSVTKNAEKSRAAGWADSMRLNTQVLMMMCRRFSRKVARIMAISEAPWAYIPTVMISLAPAKTSRDIPQVCATVKPACRAMMA